jgi:hypothetical protein
LVIFTFATFDANLLGGGCPAPLGHLIITDEEWLAFMDDLHQTLDKFGVPQPQQDAS